MRTAPSATGNSSTNYSQLQGQHCAFRNHHQLQDGPAARTSFIGYRLLATSVTGLQLYQLQVYSQLLVYNSVSYMPPHSSISYRSTFSASGLQLHQLQVYNSAQLDAHSSSSYKQLRQLHANSCISYRCTTPSAKCPQFR